ncbi:hypothetical protein [Aquimarina megaterium]|uniref:hypothetical protein n=1 Tax=Aquimarina megaterium TaxID=1443666 RepID=UPI0009438B43|nr:hypothetical protein [Aquimarina megaterium]
MIKEELEIEKLKQEIKTIHTNRIIGVIKLATVIIGSCLLFIIIQRPESILNRKNSLETINRERASMVLELLKNNNDTNEILVGLAVIEKSYPDKNNTWIKDITKYFRSKLELEDREKINLLKKIAILEHKRDSLIIISKAKLFHGNHSYTRFRISEVKDSIELFTQQLHNDKLILDDLLMFQN